jgi:hypothetical protein
MNEVRFEALVELSRKAEGIKLQGLIWGLIPVILKSCVTIKLVLSTYKEMSLFVVFICF